MDPEYPDYIFGDDYYNDFFNHSNHSFNLFFHHNDYAHGYQIYKWMLVTCIIPVCIAGLGANTVSVWVWHTNRKPNPVVLLFQCLGVLDNIFLLSLTIQNLLLYEHQLSLEVDEFFTFLIYLSQTMSVYITLVISVFRWLAISRPQQAQSMVRHHVVVTCVAVTSWCTLLSVLVCVVRNVFRANNTGHLVMFVLLLIMAFVLPILVLLAFSVSLLWLTYQHHRNQRNDRRRKMTLAVLGITICSILAWPVGMWARLDGLQVLGAIVKGNDRCSWTCYFTLIGTGELLQVLNSSINFIFYFRFASNFRPLLRRTFASWNRALRPKRKFSTISNISQITVDSCTTSSSIHQHDTKEDTVDAQERPTQTEEESTQASEERAEAKEIANEATSCL